MRISHQLLVLEQGGIRPVLIIQNNKGNLFSPTLIVAPITRNVSKRLQPTQVLSKFPITSAGRHHLFVRTNSNIG